jgi:colicin import membrane protein
MTSDLVPKNITALQLFSENGLDPVLDKIKSEIDKFNADVETEKGRKEIASFAYKIAQSKTYIEKAGKELVSGMKAKAKLIDNERKRSRDTLDQWRDEVRKPLSDWETIEAKKEEKRREYEIYKLDWDEALGMDDLFNREFARIEQARIDKEEADRKEKEQAEREERIKREAIEQAEIDAKAKIDAEYKRALDAEAAKVEAEERLKFETERAEQAKIDALKKAESDKQAAILEAKKQAENEARIKKENEDRKAAEEKAIAEKKAANTRHQAAVNNRIIADFIKCGWSEAEAKAVVVAVATGKISDMFIRY